MFQLYISRDYIVKSDSMWDIHVKETRPAGFDPLKRYPVLLSVYGGPSTQKVFIWFKGLKNFLDPAHKKYSLYGHGLS